MDNSYLLLLLILLHWHAEVLKEKDLNGVKEELEAIKPMPAAFDHNWAKRLNGTHVKKAATRWEMVEQLRQAIAKERTESHTLLCVNCVRRDKD